MQELWIANLGCVEYREAYALQERVRRARQDERIPDVLLLLEHPAVYTRGRRTKPDELPLGEDWYRAQGIDIVDVDRGGRVTYHGPGQLVGYPIMRIDDVHDFVRKMERSIASGLADEGVETRLRTKEGADYTGVWVEDRKIASIGVHVAKGVTTHGFAINVDNDLDPFEWVVPCGLSGVTMTSLAREGDLTRPVPDLLPSLRGHMTQRFAEVHARRPQAVDPAELEAAIATLASMT